MKLTRRARMPVAIVIASGPNRADRGTARAMVQGSVSVSQGVLNQTPMGLRAGALARSGVAEVANVADGVKARAPLGYDSTGFLFLVSAFSLRGFGPALFFYSRRSRRRFGQCTERAKGRDAAAVPGRQLTVPVLLGDHQMRHQGRGALDWLSASLGTDRRSRIAYWSRFTSRSVAISRA